MKLSFYVEGSDVILTIEDVNLNGYTVPFRYSCPSEFWAKMLCELLRKRMYEQLQMIRKYSYNRGWKNKASHAVPKRESFSGTCQDL